jgi:hypothetical protein
MEEVGEILAALFRRRLRKEGSGVVETLACFWPRVVGAALARNCRPAAFAHGTLTVVVDDESWAAPLNSLAAAALTRINGFLGAAIVRDLRVRTQPRYASAAFRGKKSGASAWLRPPAAGTFRQLGSG